VASVLRPCPVENTRTRADSFGGTSTTCSWRRALGEDHTRMVAQLHHLLLELIAGGAKKDLSAAQAKALLAKVRPRDAAGKARRRVAAELIADLERIYARKKAADKELRELLEATGTSLLTLNGIGPSGAARLLIDVGDITRFPTRGHFASWNGTAPLDASSGDQIRHRLSRAGNGQINRTLHIMATVQLRNPTEGRAYYDRKKASGKTLMEAMRCLKRRLSDIVYWHMVNDAVHAMTAREDTGERLRSHARPAHIPTPALRTSHSPDPPPPSLKLPSQPRLDTEGSHERALPPLCAMSRAGMSPALAARGYSLPVSEVQGLRTARHPWAGSARTACSASRRRCAPSRPAGSGPQYNASSCASPPPWLPSTP